MGLVSQIPVKTVTCAVHETIVPTDPKFWIKNLSWT